MLYHFLDVGKTFRKEWVGTVIVGQGTPRLISLRGVPSYTCGYSSKSTWGRSFIASSIFSMGYS